LPGEAYLGEAGLASASYAWRSQPSLAATVTTVAKLRSNEAVESASALAGKVWMDRLTPVRRSANMARIRAKDTEPELVVRSVLHCLGFRFRLHRRDLPGTPDITLPKYQMIILVHGCFWHRHPKCRFAYSPKSRVDFWLNKFAKNVARDKLVRQTLLRMGWKVLVIWECETTSREALEKRLRSLLRKGARP
jgi:DNA mismatch endonuclease, patch repair protein